MVVLSEATARARGARLRRRAALRPPTGRSRAITGCRSTPPSARGWRPRCPPARRWSRRGCTRPSATRALLRALRVRNFAGELLDDAGDASRAPRSTPVSTPTRWRAGWPARTSRRRRGGQGAARGRRCRPRACSTTSSRTGRAGRRYTCPSYEIVRARRRRPDRRARLPAVRRLRRDPGQPGARPRAPRAARRAWRRCSLGGLPAGLQGGRGAVRASRSGEAREALGRVATERHVGADGFWSL